VLPELGPLPAGEGPALVHYSRVGPPGLPSIIPVQVIGPGPVREIRPLIVKVKRCRALLLVHFQRKISPVITGKCLERDNNVVAPDTEGSSVGQDGKGDSSPVIDHECALTLITLTVE